MSDQSSSAQRMLDRRFAKNLEWARWAIDRWSAFPVDRIPRPLVMVGERVVVEQGFKTGEAKRAFLERRIEWRVAVPPTVRDQLIRPTELRGQLSPGPPLVIAAADRDEKEFVTDRGPRRLPAWRLRADDALGPIWILDPDVADWHPPEPAAGRGPDTPPPPGKGVGARIEVADDDCTLTVYWLGAAPEYERYPWAEAVESDRAVALVAHGEDLGWTGIRRAIGHIHRVPARLRGPLGACVCVDLHGSAGQAIKSPGR
jgi:hypothetical protein